MIKLRNGNLEELYALIQSELCDWISSWHVFCFILLLEYVLLLNYKLKLSWFQFPLPLYLKSRMGSACALLRQFFSGIAWILLIFQSSIAIPIPGLQYCIAIQNSKTCSSLIFGILLNRSFTYCNVSFLALYSIWLSIMVWSQ